ncbi:recombinase family protein [Mesobacillus foraminis]|uniref:recombinase family protein n=1 Tax=Mesobacillus foraminis TaxID=279826 RepID=UPI0039A2BEAD
MRCAVYARVSTELDSQRTSIENQIDIFRDYTSKQGNWDIVNVYTDKKSGTKENRPGLKALIEDGKNGLYDVVLAKELSRLARNGKLSYELRDMCNDHGIHIVCLDNSINTIEGNSQNFGLYAWLYENESANSSRRNKQAKRAKARRGMFVGSHPPYGYRLENGVLYIKSNETPTIVRRIFQEYLSGKGMDTIAKNLTAEQIPTPAQAANKANASDLWHSSTIKGILSNRHYIGDLVQKRSETISVTSSKRRKTSEQEYIIKENAHEAIITKEIFATVQAMMANRTRTGTAPQKHLFTNFLYCEECNKGMWYKANQKGYRCGGNIKHGTHFCQSKVAVREKELKNVILEDLKELFKTISNGSFMETMVGKLNSKKQSVQKELVSILKEIEMCRKQKLDHVNLYTEGILNKEDLMELKQTLDAKVESLMIKQAHLNEDLIECENKDHITTLKEKLSDLLNLKDLTPQILNSLVEKVTCQSDGTIHIKYSFENPLQET